MTDELKNSDLTALPLTIQVPTELHPVASALQASLFGIDSLENFVEIYYKAWKTGANFEGFNVLTVITTFSLPFLSAITSVKNIPAEILDLQDDEIATLVNISSEYELGDQEVKARQVLKLILTGFQTYSAFK